MSGARKFDRNDRLEAYLAALRPPSWKDALKRCATHWQLYAAVTGSAMAMAANAPVTSPGAGIRELAVGPAPNFLAAKHPSPISQGTPLARAVMLAMAKRNSGRFIDGKAPAIVQASQTQLPVVAAGGIVPVDSTAGIIQPGEWVSIYGTNLAGGTAVWNGDFPTSLGGTSVEINGKAAFLSLVSPGQINLQAPDDTASGPVSVVVTTNAGTATSTVTLSQFSPSFLLRDPTHVTAIILRPDGSGAYGNGSYDILGPTGFCFGYYTVAARPGDVIEMFGVGFGPTTPAVPAGMPFSSSAPINNVLSFHINNIPIQPSFVGLSGAGLYQVNLVIPPGLGEGDVPIQASIGGIQTQEDLMFSLHGVTSTAPFCLYTGDGDGDGDGGYYGDGGDGDGGYGDGGDGGDGDGDGGDGGGDGGDGGDGC